MSKHNELIRRLAKAGWSVSEEGFVIKPSGVIRECITKVSKRGPDYKVFNVKDEGISRPVHVHKLVAFLKFGSKSFKLQVRHLNGLSLDNSSGNIGVGTGSENMMDRPAEERRAHAIKAARFLRKLTDEEVGCIRESLETGRALAERFNVAPSTVSGVRNNKIYRSI